MHRVLLLLALLLLAALGLWWGFEGADPAIDPQRPGAETDPPRLRGVDVREMPRDTEASAPAEPTQRWELSGRVVTPAGSRAVADAEVRVYLRTELRPTLVTTLRTNAEGTFHALLPQVDALSPTQIAIASLHLEASRPGPTLATTLRGEQEQRLSRAGWTRRVHSTLRVRSVRGPRIVGRVIGVDGRHAEGAVIEVGGDGAPRSYEYDPLTDADGVYRVTLKRPVTDAIWLEALRAGEGTSRRVPFVPPPDCVDCVGPDLVLEAAHGIDGRVVFPDGSPAARVRIAMMLDPEEPTEGRPSFGRRGDSAVSDDEGRFALRGLRPGKGHVFVHEPGYPPRKAADALRVVTRTGDRDVMLEIPYARLRVHVRDPDGNPVTHAQLHSDAASRLDLNERQSTANLWVPSTGRILLTADHDALLPSEQVVDLRPDVWSQEVEMVLAAWDPAASGRMRIEITPLDGAEIQSARVSLYTAESKLLVGLFRSRPWTREEPVLTVPSGPWSVAIRSNDTNRSASPAWVTSHHRVEVVPEREIALRCTAWRTGRIEISIRAPRRPDGPMPSPTLTLDPHDDRWLSRRWPHANRLDLQIPQGRWTMRAEHEGCRTVEETLDINPGKTTKRLIRLERK